MDAALLGVGEGGAPVEEPRRPCRRRVAAGAVLATAVVLVWGAQLFVLCVMVPKHEEIYRDFGVTLPGLTLAAIYTSHWLLGNAPGQAVPGIVVVSIALVPAVFLVLWTAVRPRYGLLALTALLISSAVLLAATWLAVWIPLQEMIDSLQAAP